MKHRCLALGLILLAVLTLTGCACEHDWMAADCVNPQTCAKCEEIGEVALGHDWHDVTCIVPRTCSRCGATEGEALGHEWAEASCAAPQTCSRCAETQGEALAHSYGDWAFGDELMSHTCSVCNYFEELPIDRELYLESLLVGYWDPWSVYYPGGPDFDGHEKDWGVEGDLYSAIAYLWSYEGSACLQFHENKTFTLETRNIFTGNITGNNDIITGTWSITEHEPDGEIPFRLVLRLSKDFFRANILYLDCSFSDDGELMLKLNLSSLFGFEWTMTFYRERDEMLEGLCGNWGVVTNAYSDESYCFQIRPDRTATCYIEGVYEGTWSLGANPFDRSYVKFNIEYVKDGKSEMFTGYYNTPNEYYDIPTLSLSDSNRDFDFHEISDEEFVIRQDATDLLAGTWTSVGFGSSNPAHADPATMDYSFTAEKDGSFTLILPDRKTYTGSWSASNCQDHYCQYYLYFSGLQKSNQCILNAKGGDAYLGIDGIGSDANMLYFKQMREEAIAGPTLPVGTWAFDKAYNGTTGKPADTADCSITFHEDGTFSGQLNQGIRGTWKYYNYDESTVYGSDGSEEVYDNWTYLLYVEGKTEPEYIRIEKYKNEEQFTLRIPVTDSDGNRTTYVFNRDKLMGS